MQMQITIQLLMGSVKNDVLYIHHGRDGLTRRLKVDNELLSLVKGRPWQEPWLHPTQAPTPKLGDSQGPSSPMANVVVGC